jgi:hypothetical protein
VKLHFKNVRVCSGSAMPAYGSLDLMKKTSSSTCVVVLWCLWCVWVIHQVLWSSYDRTWYCGPDKQEIFILMLTSSSSTCERINLHLDHHPVRSETSSTLQPLPDVCKKKKIPLLKPCEKKKKKKIQNQSAEWFKPASFISAFLYDIAYVSPMIQSR